MHSAILRGSDFHVVSHGLEISHAGYCKEFHTSTKVGIYSPGGVDAVGATNLILLLVTSFYDRLRSIGNDFYIYPEYYTFQEQQQITDYAMFDIYPPEKNHLLKNGMDEFFDIVHKKKFQILLLPEENNVVDKLTEEQKSKLSEIVQKYYLYSISGEVKNPNLIITTNHQEISEWKNDVVDTYRGEYKPKQQKGHILRQTFQELKFT